MTDRSRHSERGQLILIGALGLAIVLLGLAVVFNSVVLADETSSAAIESEVDSVGVFNKHVRKDVRTLTVHVNHRQVYGNPNAQAKLNGSLRANVSEYGRVLATTYAADSGTQANASFVRRNETGVRIVQAEDGTFEDSGGTDDWTPVGGSSPGAYPGEREVGWFVMNVNATQTSDRTQDSFTILIEGDGGENVSLELNQNASTEGVESALDVDSNVSTGANGSVTCLASGDRVLLDVVAGRCVNEDGKVVPTVEDLQAPYSIEFENGTDGYGKYSIVTAPDASASYTCGASPTFPCTTPVAWSIEVDVTYRTDDLSYANRQNVTVYDGGG